MRLRPARAARLEDRLHLRANNFDVLRLVAATLVLVSHCYPLTGRVEPFGELSGWTMGEVGVVMFFAMSGFLIAKSWHDQPQLVPFAVKRALRLMPALVVAVSFTALVIGPVFSSLPTGTYLADPGTWVYIVRNSVLYTVSGRLPGVYEDNVYPDAVNGSLWTLPVEACAYVMAAGLGVLGILRNRAAMLACAIAALLLASDLSPLTGSATETTAGGNLPIVLELIATFLLGSLMFAVRDRLRLSWVLLGLLVAVWVVCWNSPMDGVTGILAVGYGVLVLAFRTPAEFGASPRRATSRTGSTCTRSRYSRQWPPCGGPSLTPLTMFAVAFPITYACALLSWRVIERPALRPQAARRARRDLAQPGSRARSRRSGVLRAIGHARRHGPATRDRRRAAGE